MNASSPDACPACGWDAEKGAVVCPACGSKMHHEHKPAAEEPKAEECEHWSEKPAHSVRTAKVGVGGILILLAGFLGITHAMFSVLPGTGEEILSAYESFLPPGEAVDEILQTNQILAAIMMLFGILAVALSMFAFNRTRFDAAVVACVFGVLSIGFLFGAFFAIVALLLILTSRREFLPECG